jgi:hypothetical protein
VWREAHSGDAVCVTEKTRSETATDNAQAAARRVASAPPPAAPSPTPAVPHPRLPDERVVQLGPGRGSDVSIPQGSLRSLDCTRDQIQGSKPVTLQPNQTLDVKFVTPNCGSKDRPSFRPNVVRLSRID